MYFRTQLGAVNVQIIMEKLGGGGHQTMSATQLSDINKEQALKMLIEVIDTNLEDASANSRKERQL